MTYSEEVKISGFKCKSLRALNFVDSAEGDIALGDVQIVIIRWKKWYNIYNSIYSYEKGSDLKIYMLRKGQKGQEGQETSSKFKKSTKVNPKHLGKENLS